MNTTEEQPQSKWKRPKYSVYLLRVEPETKKRIYKEVERLNKEKEFGRRLTVDDYVKFAISLVQPKHGQVMKDACLTPTDRMEEEFRKYQKAHPAASRDDFNGILLRSWQREPGKDSEDRTPTILSGKEA